MADAQTGIEPFLGVFLLAHGWESGGIGTVVAVTSMARDAPNASRFQGLSTKSSRNLVGAHRIELWTR